MLVYDIKGRFFLFHLDILNSTLWFIPELPTPDSVWSTLTQFGYISLWDDIAGCSDVWWNVMYSYIKSQLCPYNNYRLLFPGSLCNVVLSLKENLCRPINGYKTTSVYFLLAEYICLHFSRLMLYNTSFCTAATHQFTLLYSVRPIMPHRFQYSTDDVI